MPRPSTTASPLRRPASAAAVFLAAIAPALDAQWQVIDLHPEAAFDSYALSIEDGHQAGYVRTPGTFLHHASLWSGTPESWVDLHPAGATESQANGVSGGMQVGWACCFDPPLPGSPVRHAVLWSGTAASWSDLEPDGTFGEAAGIFGGQQVGTSWFGAFDTHAWLWMGTAASKVDLHPPAGAWSFGLGTDGVQQVGYVSVDGNTRASVWTGSAGSWVNLHPNQASWSRALAVHGGEQVGWAAYPLTQHAHLWKGTKNSLVDLHPAGAAGSRANGVHAGQQVGMALFAAGGERASLWSGTAASWVDLDALLPPQYSLSEAFDIWHSGGSTYVVGQAFDTAAGHTSAILWVSPPVWTDLGSALAGVAGLPQLTGAGTLLTDTPASLSLAQAAPSAPALLFVSLAGTATPFKGGTLVPVSAAATLPLTTTGAGAIQLAVPAWPSGTSGLSLYVQCAIQDVAAVHGVALSNALRGDVP